MVKYGFNLQYQKRERRGRREKKKKKKIQKGRGKRIADGVGEGRLSL